MNTVDIRIPLQSHAGLGHAGVKLLDDFTHQLIGTIAQGDRNSWGRHGSLGCSRCGNRASLRCSSNGIFLGDTTTTARTCDVSCSNTLFIKDLAGRRASRASRSSSRRCRSGSRSSFRCIGSRCSCTCFGFGIDTSDQLARDNGFTVGLNDLNQHAGAR